jgi:hypothetical protein
MDHFQRVHLLQDTGGILENGLVQQSIWVDPAILTWSAARVKWASHQDAVARAYAHWQHADQVLKGGTGELSLVDVITTLHRTVEQRLRALEDAYRFKTIPLNLSPVRPSTSSGSLESFAHSC